jgi:hypothetical protein
MIRWGSRCDTSSEPLRKLVTKVLWPSSSARCVLPAEGQQVVAKDNDGLRSELTTSTIELESRGRRVAELQTEGRYLRWP